MQTTTIEIAGEQWEVPVDVARAAGWESSRAPHDLSHVFAAMGEGFRGTGALLRAVAIRAERIHALELAHRAIAAQDLALHAARVRRQAAMLECRAARMPESIE